MKVRIDQCQSARGIAEAFGTEKALGYLIGEKLLNFVAEIRRIFEPSEIRVYLDNVHRVGAEGHACTNEQYEVLRDAGALDRDIVRGAEDVIVGTPGDSRGMDRATS